MCKIHLLACGNTKGDGSAHVQEDGRFKSFEELPVLWFSEKMLAYFK